MYDQSFYLPPALVLFADKHVACVPLPLHLEMAQGSPGLPARQSGLGVPEIWQIGVGLEEGTIWNTRLDGWRFSRALEFSDTHDAASGRSMAIDMIHSISEPPNSKMQVPTDTQHGQADLTFVFFWYLHSPQDPLPQVTSSVPLAVSLEIRLVYII
jgi:hypothetical protein